MYFRICPYCNANLDPGEQCDCMKKSRPSDSNPKGGAGNQNGFPKTLHLILTESSEAVNIKILKAPVYGGRHG